MVPILPVGMINKLSNELGEISEPSIKISKFNRKTNKNCKVPQIGNIKNGVKMWCHHTIVRHHIDNGFQCYGFQTKYFLHGKGINRFELQSYLKKFHNQKFCRVPKKKKTFLIYILFGSNHKYIL